MRDAADYDTPVELIAGMCEGHCRHWPDGLKLDRLVDNVCIVTGILLTVDAGRYDQSESGHYQAMGYTWYYRTAWI